MLGRNVGSCACKTCAPALICRIWSVRPANDAQGLLLVSSSGISPVSAQGPYRVPGISRPWDDFIQAVGRILGAQFLVKKK